MFNHLKEYNTAHSPSNNLQDISKGIDRKEI